MNVFPIAPAESRYLWFLIPIAALLVGVMIMLAVSIRSSRTASFQLLSDGLRLRGDLYGRTIPFRELRIEQARRVDFALEPQLRPGRKRVGTGLPGYQSGWFRLKNGEKALVYLTDRSKAVYVPTSGNYSLLLSPLDPDGFLGALRTQRR